MRLFLKYWNNAIFLKYWNGTGPLFQRSAVPKVRVSRVRFRVSVSNCLELVELWLVELGLGLVGLGLD